MTMNKKIAFYSPLFIVGGMETAVYHLAKLLKETGRYDILFISRSPHSDKMVMERYLTVDQVKYLTNGKQRYGAVWRLTEEDCDIYCDVLINCSNWDFVLPTIHAKKTIHWIHGTYLANPANLNRNNQFVTQSQWQRDKIFKDGMHIEVIPNIMDEKVVEELALEYPIFNPMQKFVDMEYIMVCRLSNEKGFSRLVEFMQRPQNSNALCRVIGEAFTDDVDKHIRDILFPVRDKVIMMGKLANPYPHIKASDAVLVFSDFETYGLVSKEAHILGKPVIFHRFDTAKDQFIEGVDQWLGEVDIPKLRKVRLDYKQTEKASVLKRWEELFNAN